MKTSMLNSFALISLGISGSLALSSCGGDVTFPSISPTTSYVQVERLARPAINEGLILSNGNLNLWNSVPPSADLSPAGSGIVTEAGGTLTAIHDYAATAGLVPPPVGQVVSGFLPDVMRIDTSVSFPGSISSLTSLTGMAYSGCLGPTNAILCGGRKLRDNVAMITANYLVNGNNSTTPFSTVTYDPAGQSPPAVLAGFPTKQIRINFSEKGGKASFLFSN